MAQVNFKGASKNAKKITIKLREPQPRNCDICGKPVKLPDEMWVGGYLSYAHNECAELADKGVRLYLRWLTLSHVSITQFAKDIIEAEELSTKSILCVEDEK